jgi:hypothetical protein
MVQPRVQSVFAPVTNQQQAPMSEAVTDYRQSGVWEREPEVGRHSGRVLPGEKPVPRLVTPLVPPIERSIREQQAGDRTPDEPRRQSPVAEDSSPVRPLPLEGCLRREVSRAAQREATGSDPVSVVEVRLSNGVEPEYLHEARPVEVPPRLVKERIESRVERVSASAPPSLVPAGIPGMRSQTGAHDTSEPTVHVTIGRIDVTAVTPPPAPKRTVPVRQPSMSLQDYLARRQGRSL